MARTLSFATYCLIAAAAGACAVAIALGPTAPEVPDGQPSGDGASGYLDCSRVFPDRVVEPDLVAECSVVAVHAGVQVAT